MKKLIVIVLSAIMVFFLVACSKNTSVNGNSEQRVGGNSIRIPVPFVPATNPFVEFKTLKDAQKLAGFKVTVPEKMPEGYSESVIHVIKDKMIEIIYVNGDDKICIRKGKGSKDISGVYGDYKEINMVTVDNMQVKMQGSDGKVNVATWVDEEYTFAIDVNPAGSGMDSTAISDMVRSIH